MWISNSRKIAVAGNSTTISTRKRPSTLRLDKVVEAVARFCTEHAKVPHSIHVVAIADHLDRNGHILFPQNACESLQLCMKRPGLMLA